MLLSDKGDNVNKEVNKDTPKVSPMVKQPTKTSQFLAP
jgi:hypothetical protein